MGASRVHRNRPSRWVAVLAAAAVLLGTAACGARLSDEQMASARGQAGGTAPAAPGDAAAAGAPATGETTTTTAAAGPVEAAPPSGGEAAPAPVAGGPCQPQGGSGPGLTASEITIGNVSTISGPVPGLGKTAQDGVKAYVNYVNSKGGVCGRKLKLVTSDDRLDTGTNRAETQRLMGQVFAFVGGFSVVDDGGASVLQGTDVPDVGLAINDNRIGLPNNFSPNPIDPTSPGNGTQKMQAYFKSNFGVTKAAIVFPAQASARKRALAYEVDMRAAGLEVVVKAEVAITQTDYTGVATQIKNSGAELVMTALEVGGMAKLAQALKQQNYTPKVPFYGAQAYGSKFLELAGPAAEGTVLGIAYSTIEDAPSVPSMAAFQQWYARTVPGGDVDFFAILSWAATEILVQAITQAGPTPTREAVLGKLRGMTDTDAGGALAPRTNPAGKKPSPCFQIVAVQGGKWVRKHPAKGFQC